MNQKQIIKAKLDEAKEIGRQVNSMLDFHMSGPTISILQARQAELLTEACNMFDSIQEG